MSQTKFPRISTNRCKLLPALIEGKDVLDIGCVNHDLQSRERVLGVFGGGWALVAW